MRLLISLTMVALFVAGLGACDQLPGGSRYEVVVDKNGRTIRLDKKTGEITIIEDDKLISPKSAAEADQAKRSERLALAKEKTFPPKTIKHMFIEVKLSTSWQDGNVYYNVEFIPLQAKDKLEKSGAIPLQDATAKKGTSEMRKPANLQAFRQEMTRHNFSLTLEDLPFELMRQKLTLTYHADEKGEIQGYGAMELTRFSGRFSAWVTSGYPQAARGAPQTQPSAQACG